MMHNAMIAKSAITPINNLIRSNKDNIPTMARMAMININMITLIIGHRSFTFRELYRKA